MNPSTKKIWREYTYMKRCLTIDVGAIYIDFVVVEQRNHIVNVCMIDGMEHDIVAHLFD